MTRELQAEGEGETDYTLSREPKEGLDPRTPDSWPLLKADAKTTEPPRCPQTYPYLLTTPLPIPHPHILFHICGPVTQFWQSKISCPHNPIQSPKLRSLLYSSPACSTWDPLSYLWNYMTTHISLFRLPHWVSYVDLSSFTSLQFLEP